MTVIESAKSAITCSQCGDTIRLGRDCAQIGERVLCMTCYEIANDPTGKHTSFCIVRAVRALIRRLV